MIALDPTPASVLRVAGKYRYKLLVKAKNTARMRALVRELLCTFRDTPTNRHTNVFVDINPAVML